MRTQYTITQAVDNGLAESAAIVQNLIYSGDVAARFALNKWWIPASEMIRVSKGLPIDQDRRREIMGDLLLPDGSVVRPRTARSANEAAA